MANSLLTINMITAEAVRLFKNSNLFIQNIDSQYDNMFAIDGAKIGTSVRIRLPNDYTVRSGPALQLQDTVEQSTTLNLSTQRGVDVGFTSVDRTMSLDNYSERILSPMMNNLAGNVALTVMQGSEGGVCNIVTNLDGAGNIISPTTQSYLNSNAVLDDNSANMDYRRMVLDPTSDSRAVGNLTGLFNPATELSEQFKSGRMRNTMIGYSKWFRDQTVIKHTTGSFSAGTVSGANQTGTTLTVNAITGTLALGDIITIAGVNAVNRVTKQDLGVSRQFVLTAAAANGATSLSIYPAIIPPVGGANVQYQTVTASPGNTAVISLATPASGVYRKSFGFVREAITMATADLVIPKNQVEASRAVYDGISMRMLSSYLPGTDQIVTRSDVLFGYLYIRPEWCCIVADKV